MSVPHETQEKAGGAYGLLTAKEREVLEALCDGLSQKEIANRLEVAPKTVDSHVIHIKKKTGIHRATGLVRWAIRVGLVNP